MSSDDRRLERCPRTPTAPPASAARRSLGLLAAAVLMLAPLILTPAVSPAEAQVRRPEKAEVELVADRDAYRPGEEARLAAVMTIEEEWHTNSHRPTYDWLIPTVLSLELPEGWTEAEVSYPEGAMKSFAFTEEPISVYDGTVRFLIRLKVPEGAEGEGAPVQANLRYQACDYSSCLPPVTSSAQLVLTLGPGGEPINQQLFGESFDGALVTTEAAISHGSGGAAEAAAEAPPDAGSEAATLPVRTSTGLLMTLLLGFLGGVILNVMPCVLPVLSLKVFGMIKSAEKGDTHVVSGALATTAGIVLSFWALAGAAALARAAGAAVGWGTQFQHPGFVTFLAVVVVLFCLNLWGLFEIPLPQRLAQAASGGPREGYAGHLASGLFATLMATPCSAPFLGTAVGFALAQPAWLIFAIFTAIGLGMSLPYLVLAVAPGAAKVFPKPGAWMEHVRKIMGFLLAGAAVWLLYVLANQVSPERLALIQVGLLVLCLFVWMGTRMARGRTLKRVAAVGLVAAAVGTMVLAAQPGAGPAADGGHGNGLIDWVAFDRAEALELSGQEGRLVFVDVTADWCITCKANERLVLETEQVATAFERHGVVPMKADWTNRDDRIGTFLAEFGKAGIPFYVLYRPGDEPHVFSELLTKDAVVSALAESDGAVAAAAR